MQSQHLQLTHSRPLPRTARHNTRPTPRRRIIPLRRCAPPPPLLLLIEHQLQHIVRKLRKLETHGAKLWFCIVAQAVTPAGPERRDRLADRVVLGIAFLADVAGVREFALSGRRCAKDFAVRERFEVEDCRWSARV